MAASMPALSSKKLGPQKSVGRPGYWGESPIVLGKMFFLAMYCPLDPIGLTVFFCFVCVALFVESRGEYDHKLI